MHSLAKAVASLGERSPMTRAGAPPTIFQSPTSLVATAPAATMAPRPIRPTPSQMMARLPIQASSAMTRGVFRACGFWVVTVRVRVDDDRFGNDDALANDQRATEIEDRVPVDLRMRADHAFRVGKFSIDARVPSYGYAVSELDLARESQGGVGQDADTRAAGPEISAPQCRPQHCRPNAVRQSKTS